MPVRVQVAVETAADGFGPDVGGWLEAAVRAALADRGVRDAELSVALIDDAAMAGLNRRWTNRDGPTDVLAFPLHAPDESPVGDLYLGAEQALRQAAEHGEPPRRELARIAIHGTLHVLGWDHPEDDRERSEMWLNQERILGSVAKS